MPNFFTGLFDGAIALVGTVTTVTASPALALASTVWAKNLVSSNASKLEKIPEVYLKQISPFYPKLDLKKVRYAVDAETPLLQEGNAITIGYDILFPRKIDFHNKENLRWLLHELEHCRQYKAHRGIYGFMLKYWIQGGAETSIRARDLVKGEVNIHDKIRLEQEAIQKAARIIDKVYPLQTPPNTSSSYVACVHCLLLGRR